MALLPPNVHGRLVARTMRPRYITIHSTQDIGATAAKYARYLILKGNRSRNNPRFGRSGWLCGILASMTGKSWSICCRPNKEITPTTAA
jgi:hypothetical protein